MANPSWQTQILLLHKPLNGGQFNESQADDTVWNWYKHIMIKKSNLFEK